MVFDIILACDSKRGIGINGGIPWDQHTEDMIRFKKITTGEKLNYFNSVIMGRKTWDSLPIGSKPLPGRTNWIMTSDVIFKIHSIRDELVKIYEDDDNMSVHEIQYNNDADNDNISLYGTICIENMKEKTLSPIYIADDLNKVLDHLKKIREMYDEGPFVIGGGEIYEQAYKRIDCHTIHLTQFNEEYKCDTFAPSIPPWMKLTTSSPSKDEKVSFLTYENISYAKSDENQYTNLIKQCLSAPKRICRNGQVHSIFGP